MHISDIHFDKCEPENQGLIINAFFKDLNSLLVDKPKDDIYCIISGDLVQAGNSSNIYDSFYNKFIKRLMKIISVKNIICTPGNHDLNRNIIENNFEEYQKLVNKDYSEVEFNNLVKEDKSLISQKFYYYRNFCEDRLSIPNFNIYGYSVNLIPEISCFCLNSALLLYGGLNKINDERILKIETSELNKWLDENDGRKKILILHHPFEHLSEYAQKELNSMLRSGIDIIISGHIHDQNLENSYISQEAKYIKCSSPQLFSDKTDLNGYSILHFEDSNLLKIEYRQWSKRQRKFMSGQEFSGTENGIFEFKKVGYSKDDFILEKLKLEFLRAMKTYSVTPEWADRILTTCPPNAISKDNEIKLDYLDVINKKDNYQIIAAPQFGLTCYARYLALKAWEVKNEIWFYVDCSSWRLSKVEVDIEDFAKEYQIDIQDIKCILLDDWRNSIKDSSKILEKIKKILPNIPIIILSNYDDTILIEGLDTEESHIGFKPMYLKELTRKGIRQIVRCINDTNQIADENKLLERLTVDLNDLNIHRTPLNCLQLLLAFQVNFDNRPINRSKVFKFLLRIIFDNPGNLFYGDNLDEDNCSFLLGYFCEYLLRNGKEDFTEKEFIDETTSFGERNYNTSNVLNLLQILKNNQVLVECNGFIRFRFSYWIYFFAAERMKLSEDFANFMFGQKHSIYYPEIIEFYTGTDGAREDAAKMIIHDLNELSAKVHKEIGIRDDINPFSDIKWTLNEKVKGMTQEQLELSVKESKLPDEIKDAVADKDYNSIKPYNQTISDFLEEYDVKNLMNLTKSASRALRNSEFISSNLKEELADGIFKSWKEIVRVLFLLAPILAKNGFGGVGGARFKLADDFPKEYQECLKNIVIVLPFNIMNWYKDDLFSDKLVLLFKKFLIEHESPIIRHILSLLISSSQPKNWHILINNYIGSIGKNSYYLGDLYGNLRGNYSTKYMLPSDLKYTEDLIKSCWIKHKDGIRQPGINSISKVPNDKLPMRKDIDF